MPGSVLPSMLFYVLICCCIVVAVIVLVVVVVVDVVLLLFSSLVNELWHMKASVSFLFRHYTNVLSMTSVSSFC